MRCQILLLFFCSAAFAGGIDRKVLKNMEAFGVKWWKARPPTKFQYWDRETRAALLREARGFGGIPEGSWEKVRNALWKSIRKYGPKGKKGKGLMIPDHGYKSRYTNDRMWAQVSGTGKGKGLVMSLHGGGEGAGSADASWALKDCMTIAPQGLLIHGDNWNRVHGEKQILTYIEIAKAQYNVDPDRVFCCGFSMGGTGSWHMAGRFPDLLAGAAPCAGVIMANPVSQVRTKEEVNAIQYGLIPNVRNLAMYYFIGLEDKNTMPGTYLFIWDMIEELRAADPGGYQNIHFKTYPGLAHAYPPGEPTKAKAFLSKQRRNTFPEQLVWEFALSPHPKPDEKDTTGRYVKRWFYWMRHDRPADRMEIKAIRKGNEFDIEVIGAELEGCYLMLNPEMIDVTREVVVRLDGEEFYRGIPEPDFVTVVESLEVKLDRRMFFDRKIPLWK